MAQIFNIIMVYISESPGNYFSTGILIVFFMGVHCETELLFKKNIRNQPYDINNAIVKMNKRLILCIYIYLSPISSIYIYLYLFISPNLLYFICLFVLSDFRSQQVEWLTPRKIMTADIEESVEKGKIVFIAGGYFV